MQANQPDFAAADFVSLIKGKVQWTRHGGALKNDFLIESG